MFKQNMAIIRTRWPDIGERLDTIEQPHQIEPLLETPEPSLLVDNRHLTSCYNREQEAKIQAQHIAIDAPEVTVYGMALGDLPRLLLTRQSLQQLNLILLSPAVTRAALEHFDQTDWLADPRVNVSLATAEKNLRTPYCVAPMALRFADEQESQLRDLIRIDLNRASLDRYFKNVETVMAKQLAANQDLYLGDGDVASLFNSQPNSHIVVVAGGPTAHQQWSWLREQRDQLTIIAVNTALKPLQDAGIQADVAIIVDHVANAIEHITPLTPTTLQSMPLVYLPVVHRDVLTAWPGKRLVTWHQNPLFATLREQHPRGELWSSGTVTHDAVDLAIKMGASTVTFVGLDFSFVNNQSHTQGATLAQDVSLACQQGDVWVSNGLGKRTPSSAALVMYLRELERHIQRHPDVHFINTGRAGAQINGSHWQEVALHD